MIFVVGDSTSIRMHELFIERYGGQYDRYRGTNKNTYRDGTWNCRNTDFVISDVIPTLEEYDIILFNAGLWDVGVHPEVQPLDLIDYRRNTNTIIKDLKSRCAKLFVFETIEVRSNLGLNTKIKTFNEALYTNCVYNNVHHIRTKGLFDDTCYAPEGFHLKDQSTKKLFDIIVTHLENRHGHE